MHLMKHAIPIMTRKLPTVRGFTLIELMVTIAVGGILIAMAVPAFNDFVLNDRDIGQINSLVASFSFARSEAIKLNNGGIQVCPSSDGLACNGTTNWAGGWIVADTLGDPPLQYVPAFTTSNTVSASLAGQTGVTFASTGLVSQPVTIKICDTRGGSYARDVEVNATGRIEGSRTPGYSVSNVALTCP
jgi:type IV fimbrial biogenesis protein FimT